MGLVLKFVFFGECGERRVHIHILSRGDVDSLLQACILTLSETAFSVLAGKFSSYSKQIFHSEYATVCLVIDESN